MKKFIALCVLTAACLVLAGTTVYASTVRTVTLTYNRARAIFNEYTRAETEDARIINERTLREFIANMENAAMQIIVAQSRLTLEEESLRHAYIRYNFGLISADMLQTAQRRLAQQQADLENAQASFLALQREFNQMLGLPIRQNTLLTWTRTLTGAPENIDRFIRTRMHNAPQLRALQEQHFIPDGVMEAARRTAENNIHAAYTALVQLVEQATLAQQAYENAVKELETAITRHEMGQITRFDVEMAQHQLLVSEIALETLRNRQWAAEFRLLHPH
ncbi:MAG: TolC family protein [Defluviitaleaceae bacterium]|nr:TolC family protein [Defluviitaleaceae bacterium]MCL2276053.1 TolC family protein [Defluviitaleaceae bacterium]